MAEATRVFFDPSLWKKELEASSAYQTTSGTLRELFISCAMHMGSKSLELLAPGGVEKFKGDLERIANGICISDEEKSVDEASAIDSRAQRILKAVGDPWLCLAFPTLQDDLAFTLWSSWQGDEEDEEGQEPLMKAIRSPPQQGQSQEA
jgi:hypothetical protein